MAFPLLNFQAINPMGNMLNTAMGAYSGINEGIAKQLQNQKERQMLPFYLQEADLVNQLRKYSVEEQKALDPYREEMALYSLQKSEAEAKKQKQIADLMEAFTSGIGGGASERGNMPGGIYSAGGPNDLGSQFVRKLLGLPDETPQEKMTRDVLTHQENQKFNKELEKIAGTSSHITSVQNQAQAIRTLAPTIEELANLDIPYQLGVTAPWNINAQAVYKATTAEAVDKVMGAFNLPKNEITQKTVEKMIEKQPFETAENYKSRMNHLIEKLASTHKEIGAGELKLEKNSHKMVDILAPDGNVYMIPENEAEEAIKAGGRRV